MKGITCNNAIEAEGFRSALMEAGIESSIYDETNSKVARGVLDQAVDVLVNEEDYDKAQELYQTFQAEQQDFKPWCPKCGSENVTVEKVKCTTARQLPRILAALLMFTPFGSSTTEKCICNDCGHIDKRYLKECPVCHSKNVDYMTRIIGYLKRVSNFSQARQEEAARRFYAHTEA